MNSIKKILYLSALTTIMLYPNFWFQVAPLKKVLADNPTIQYIPCYDETYFEYDSFPLSINQNNHPNTGSINPLFILKIPQATSQSLWGDVLIKGNIYIQEMIWKNNLGILENIQKHDKKDIIPIPGSVAVITQFAFYNYFHWLTEVLTRLALLEIQGIEYDWLYVPLENNYMKSSLKLWGIDENKIISPDQNSIITADEIILPSRTANVSFGNAFNAAYVHPELLKYVRNKLLAATLEMYNYLEFSKKIFISRKDAPIRKIINEDDIFKEFEKYGFVRYELTNLSVEEQIMLFYNAEIIISPQGTSTANIIFCTPKTKVIEIFQGLNDCTFWYISQILNLNYTPIATIDFIDDYFKAWQSNTYMPISIIEKIVPYF
jgi:hypothetical protein